MKAVVMAGGFGTRIQPLTNAVPKPMLPILNRPMMEDVVIRLKKIGIKEFIFLLYFKADVVRNYFGDGSEFGIKIDYVVPDDDYGTAGAVKKAQDLIGKSPFFIVSGDLITDFDFAKIVDYHKEKSSKLTITVTPVVDPLQFGVVIVGNDGKIERFLEKPSWGEVFSDTINTGIYILEPEILDEIPADTNYDFSKDLFPKLMKKGLDLWGFSTRGYWRDVGNPSSYREVIDDIFLKKVNLPIMGEKIVFDNGVIYVGDNVKMDTKIKVKGVNVLGNNIDIEGQASIENIVVGDNTVIGKGTTIKNSTIWNDCFVGERVVIKNSVICNNVIVGKKTEISQGAIIAERCELEKGVRVEKDIIIWPNKLIEEGSIVSQNVIWGDKYKKSIFEGGKVSGHTNVELSCDIAIKLAQSFAAIFPAKTRIFASRDYHNASRMLKQAFVGGLLSSGIEIVNSKFVPSNVLINSLIGDEKMQAGVHFRQSETSALESEILFYDKNGMLIDTATEKACERIFFRENFRRVSSDEIEAIIENKNLTQNYIENFVKKIDEHRIAISKPQFLIDLLFGTTSTVFPQILKRLGIENVMLNTYFDDKRLSKLPTNIKQSEQNASKIIASLGYDGGFIIYPHGKKLELATNSGRLLPDHITLFVVLWLLDETCDKKQKVCLPVYSPDVFDKAFKRLEIKKTKIHTSSFEYLQKFDFISDAAGCFAFSNFAPNYDAMYACAKIIEMLSVSRLSLEEIVAKMPNMYYCHEIVNCAIEHKGFMMRKFTQDAVGKQSSFEDGVKIIEQDGSSITMIPDQYSQNLHLYVQAKSESLGKELLDNYRSKMQTWKDEKGKDDEKA